ncbi:MAG: hypothetical protein NC203_05970 [Firmicutes bacterium]|nr:hypothetical protein [[Eubacterium] siraeum]MCM1487897.1 hypothetical protein [Bacillota bacterium]
MYPEFIPVYAGLGAILLILAAVLILLIIVLRKVSRRFGGGTVNPSAGLSGKNTVFCKKCAAQYDSRESRCPNCGALR